MYHHLKIFSILIILFGVLISQDLIYAQPRIAILYSELTENNIDANSNKVMEVITSWELFLMQERIPYSVIYDDDLESGIDEEYDILILPSVNFISFVQMEALQKFLVSGNSIISSGSKLMFQESSINEYQNLKTLLGLKNIETVSSESMSYFHSLLPNHLNHFNIDDELILQISNKNQGAICDVIENKVAPAGYYLDKSSYDSSNSSIVYGSNGKGRFLFSGFDLNDVIGGKEDLAAFKKLILNTISWMDKEPDTYIDAFYESISSPVIVTLQYNNALESELIDVLLKNDIRPNLIVNPDQKVSKEILTKFAFDEIILDLSGIANYTSNNVIELIENFNRDYGVELSTLLVKKQALENIDLGLISAAGINEILYDEQAPGLPKYHNKDLLLIPFVKSNELPFSINVINFLNYNPKIDCEVNPEDELLEMINKIRSRKFNFTTLPTINRWWSVRERITCEIKNISDIEIEIWLNNKNPLLVSDLNVFLNFAQNIDRKTLTISLNKSLLEYYFDDTAGGIRIKLDKILPNSLNKIKINFTLE